MVEAIRAVRREPLNLIDRETLSRLIVYVLPAAMAVVFLLSLLLVVQRADVLRFWTEDFDGSGSFLVESCAGQLGFGADQWACQGQLTVDGRDAVERSDLIASLGAYASDRPYVGERFDVFFRPGESVLVYPLENQLNELARVYLSLIPRLLVLIGSLLWLAGWGFTRGLDPDDFVARDSMWLPQRFNWRATGTAWIIAGVVMVGINHLLTTWILGSLDIV